MTVSAPGKVHLIGDHSVVYGEPAILAAIGLRIRVEAEKSDYIEVIDKTFGNEKWSLYEAKNDLEKAEKLLAEGLKEKKFNDLFTFVKNGQTFKKIAIAKVLKELGIDGGVRMSVSGDIPIGSGVGSGASLSVNIVKAISEVYEKNLSLEQVNDLAYELEKFTHGTPSGGDNSACCYGGLVWFEKKQPKNIIISLKDEISHKLENFVLVYTKRPEKNTGELIQIVREKEPGFRDMRIKKLGEMTGEMKDVLKRKDTKRMKEIINMTQRILAELGVSIKEIDDIAAAVRRIGGAAKLCGAGGGIMLCYHENIDELKKTIRNMGYEPLETELAVEGVSVH